MDYPTKRRRVDTPVVIRDILRAAVPDQRVEVDNDATYDGREVVTVVSATTSPLAGSLPSNRFAFGANVVLTTSGEDVDAVQRAAFAVADALLDARGGEHVRLSSVMSTSEPQRTGTLSPQDVATYTSTYTTIIRSEV